jgi:ABC-type multidrug transport system fused ATPase/permease subunit
MMDDPLAAVDTHVADHLFQECIKKRLAKKTRILVTNQLHRLRNVDRIFYLSENTIKECGTYDELLSAGAQFAQMTERLSLDAKKRSSTADEAELTVHDEVAVKTSENQPAETAKKEEAKTLIQEEERGHGRVGWDAYWYYYKAVGTKLFSFAIVANMIGAASVASTIGAFILADWSQAWLIDYILIRKGLSTKEIQLEHTYEYLWHYSLTISLGFVATLFAAYFLALTRVSGSRTMHNSMINGMVNAPVSYFDVTPLGRIINRFSSDMGTADYQLSIMINFLFVMVMGVACCLFALIKSTGGYLLILIVPVMVTYYYIALYIQCTQIKVKRLEATCRSPIYSNFSEVLAGLATIRAYRQEKRFSEINLQLVKNHVAAFLTTTGGLQAWMTVRLNSISACLSLAVCVCAVYIKDLMTAGEIGLALSYSMSIVQLLSFLITMSTEVQSLMNSVERIKVYADGGVPKEASQLYNPNKKAVNGKDMVR